MTTTYLFSDDTGAGGRPSRIFRRSGPDWKTGDAVFSRSGWHPTEELVRTERGLSDTYTHEVTAADVAAVLVAEGFDAARLEEATTPWPPTGSVATDSSDATGPDRAESTAGLSHTETALAVRWLETDEATVAANHRRLPDDRAVYVWTPGRGGAGLIVGHDGTVLWANSSISPEQHLEAFRGGRRTDPALLD
jgi:hypothetical protein